MNEILKQLAIDFCTDEKSILSKENIFTEYKRLEGRRIFQEGENHDRQCGKGRYSIRSRAIWYFHGNGWRMSGNQKAGEIR